MYHEIVTAENDSKPTRVVLFDSVTEFVAKKDNPKSKQIEKGCYQYFPGQNDPWMDPPERWYDCKTKTEFENILENGHKRYTDMIMANEIIAPPTKNIKRRKIRADYGDEVDIHAVNSGNLSTSWTRKTPKMHYGPTNIRILAHISMLADVTAASAIWRGVTALSMANCLEIAGYNVALDVICGADDVTSQEHFANIVPLKPYDMPVDLQSLSASTCFPGFYRGPGFWNKGLCEGSISSGYGSSMPDDKIYKILSAYYTDPNEVIILISKDCLSKTKSENAIEKALKQFRGINEEIIAA